jgi:hypothetical protein
MSKRLFESGSLAESKTRAGVWPIRIITEGKGSSATYTRELLEASTHVFANRPMFGNHPADPSKPQLRSPFEIKAKLGPTIEYREVDGVAGLWGEAHVSAEVDAWLEEFHDIVGVSIFAGGEGEDRDGQFYVTEFDASDPYTSVDFVVAPGRGGGVEARMAEAYAYLENGTAPAATGSNEGDNRMDEATKAFIEALFEKYVGDKFTALEGKIDAATALVESVKDAQPERVEAVDTAGEIATAVAEAELGKSAVARVLESVKAGNSVVDAVKHEKDIRDEVLAEAKTRVAEGVFGGNAADDDFGVSSVRFN